MTLLRVTRRSAHGRARSAAARPAPEPRSGLPDLSDLNSMEFPSTNLKSPRAATSLCAHMDLSVCPLQPHISAGIVALRAILTTTPLKRVRSCVPARLVLSVSFPPARQPQPASPAEAYTRVRTRSEFFFGYPERIHASPCHQHFISVH